MAAQKAENFCLPNLSCCHQ